MRHTDFWFWYGSEGNCQWGGIVIMATTIGKTLIPYSSLGSEVVIMLANDPGSGGHGLQSEGKPLSAHTLEFPLPPCPREEIW